MELWDHIGLGTNHEVEKLLQTTKKRNSEDMMSSSQELEDSIVHPTMQYDCFKEKNSQGTIIADIETKMTSSAFGACCLALVRWYPGHLAP